MGNLTVRRDPAAAAVKSGVRVEEESLKKQTFPTQGRKVKSSKWLRMSNQEAELQIAVGKPCESSGVACGVPTELG
jgi:hypothetical protein